MLQLDLEMAYADGNSVMFFVETLMKSIYETYSEHGHFQALPDSSFIRMPYEEAMSKHGSDKPDIRIASLVSYSLICKHCG